MRLLIVNADDFGLNAAANAGIIECFRAGSVSSTTLMANTPGFAEAVTLAKANPGLGVGLHFNLTWGKPLLGLPAVLTLVDSAGNFRDRGRLGRQALAGRLPQDAVEQELEAQFQRLRSHGLRVTHVDSHQHVHAFSPVFSAVAKLCARERIPMRVPWVASGQAGSLARRARRAVLGAALGTSVRRWRGRVRWNDGLGSVFDLGGAGGHLSIANYREILKNAPPGVFELMVHPVTSAAAMEGYTRVGAVGEAEYRWLRRGELGELARSLGFRIGSYDDLPA
ncbi:ChbG/HpnK family deacetylase [Luteimonas sp. Sa2BVA3]|uniref:ChbG/HpnK family deacetylase n=1 Tax=Luteimonas colneyensis TaxID=2762230 RepID=A0ABR8UJW6_9GAMM|nr:ChbG/HpnK family deacetylase [Luteimonas colneyensis]MBD7988317.1 ChbG/HpnK family deacetylase [Luteimonas colneyensis]